jgi:hypothetical protein
MKPTSLIFLVLSAVLLFGGMITCSVAETMAKSQDTSIFEQVKDKNGDYVYKYSLTDEKLSKLELNFTDVNVKVIGSAKESYVELKNYDPYGYSTTLSGTTVTVDGNASGLSSIIDLSGGGLRFKGLRYFFAGSFGEGRERSVNVYISENCDVSSINIKVVNGNISFANLYNNVDYNVNVDNGNVTFDTVVTESVINLDITSGEANIVNSESASFGIVSTTSKITLDLTRYAHEFINYNVKTEEESQLVHNGSLDDDGQMKVSVSSDLQKCLVKIDASSSEVIILDNSVSITPTP